ncbi:EF-hand domain-containing protein [Luteitalea sp.]
MTISTSFQAYSVSTMRLSISVSPAPATKTPPAPGSTPPPQDRLTLSPDVTGAAPPVEVGADDTVTPIRPPTSGTNQKSAALLAGLDADKDGVLSEREFTSGARALLDRDRPGRVRQDDEDEGRRGGKRLERRFEKAFDRIDGNDDGRLDAGELTAALEGRRRRGDDNSNASTPPIPSAPPSAPSNGVSISYVSVTYVSVAVQRYTSLQPPTAQTPQPGASAGDATPVAPSTDDSARVAA